MLSTQRWTQGLQLGDHVLHLYEGEEERERAVSEAFAWLPEGAKMVVFSPNGILPGHLDHGNAGREPRSALRDGSLEVLSTDEAYLPYGRFDRLRALERLKGAADAAEREGFDSLVGIGDASWIAGRGESYGDLMRYEAEINFLKPYIDTAWICQYDRRVMPEDYLRGLCGLHEKLLTERRLERNCWLISRGL